MILGGGAIDVGILQVALLAIIVAVCTSNKKAVEGLP